MYRFSSKRAKADSSGALHMAKRLNGPARASPTIDAPAARPRRNDDSGPVYGRPRRGALYRRPVDVRHDTLSLIAAS